MNALRRAPLAAFLLFALAPASAQDADHPSTQLEVGIGVLVRVMEATAEIRRAAGPGCALDNRDRSARAGSFKRTLSVVKSIVGSLRQFHDEIEKNSEFPNFLWVEQAREMRDWTKSYSDSLKSLARISRAQLARVDEAGIDQAAHQLLIDSFAADGAMVTGLSAIDWRAAETDPPGMWWRRPDALVLRLGAQIERLGRIEAMLAEPRPAC